MSRENKTYITGLFCTVFIALAVLISGTPSFCSDEDPDEKRAIGPTKTAEVTIQKKLGWTLITKELDGVRLSRYTEYVDQSGNKIPYERLAVPCKATLVYEYEPGGNSSAVSVTVKQILPGASSAVLIVPE